MIEKIGDLKCISDNCHFLGFCHFLLQVKTENLIFGQEFCSIFMGSMWIRYVNLLQKLETVRFKRAKIEKERGGGPYVCKTDNTWEENAG